MQCSNCCLSVSSTKWNDVDVDDGDEQNVFVVYTLFCYEKIITQFVLCFISSATPTELCVQNANMHVGTPATRTPV